MTRRGSEQGPLWQRSLKTWRGAWSQEREDTSGIYLEGNQMDPQTSHWIPPWTKDSIEKTRLDSTVSWLHVTALSSHSHTTFRQHSREGESRPPSRMEAESKFTLRERKEPEPMNRHSYLKEPTEYVGKDGHITQVSVMQWETETGHVKECTVAGDVHRKVPVLACKVGLLREGLRDRWYLMSLKDE